MRFRFAPLAAFAAAFAIAPAGALAAPDRDFTFTEEGATAEWTSAQGVGAVYTSDVAERMPACSETFSCDKTLLKTDRYGNLEIGIAGKGVQGQDTMKDLDLHVYVSNANGAQGEVIQESVSEFANESLVIEDVPAGYYLVYVDWYLGTGTFDGTAKLAAPTTPDPEEPPVFVPAEDTFAETVTPARTQAFATTADPEFAWTSTPGAGVSDVVEQTGCQTVNCDYSLFEVKEAGVLSIATDGGDTLVDGDIHLYLSNAEGGLGDEVGAATAFTPDENLSLDVEPGFYLVRYQYTGAGSYDGTASLRPFPVEEPEEPLE